MVELAGRPVGESGQDPAVQSAATGRRRRLLDGDPGELMPERHPPLVVREEAQRRGSPRADRSARPRPPRAATTPRGAASSATASRICMASRSRAAARPRTASRTVVGSVGLAGGEHLRGEERVAARPPVQLDRIDGCPKASRATASAESGSRWNAFDGRHGREIAKEDADGMRSVELVVAVGSDRRGREASRPSVRAGAARRASPRRPSGDPPARGRSAAPPARRGVRRRHPTGARRAGRDPRARRRSPAMIEQRSEGAWRRGGSQAPGQDHGPRIEALAERADERGLADARLTRDEKHATAAVRRGRRRGRRTASPARRPARAGGRPSAPVSKARPIPAILDAPGAAAQGRPRYDRP